MGTNYYLFKLPIREDQEVEEGLHIGKYSCGNPFIFRLYFSDNLNSVKDFKRFTKHGYIYDEYRRPITHKDLWDKIESSVKDSSEYKWEIREFC